MKEIFCYSKIQGDFNVVSYSKKKAKSRRNKTTVHQVFFIPEKEGWESEFKRGMQFFKGMLFGARVEMMRFGKFVELWA